MSQKPLVELNISKSLIYAITEAIKDKDETDKVYLIAAALCVLPITREFYEEEEARRVAIRVALDMVDQAKQSSLSVTLSTSKNSLDNYA
jgi:hypothetical protein